jgi:hypothetical protein
MENFASNIVRLLIAGVAFFIIFKLAEFFDDHIGARFDKRSTTYSILVILGFIGVIAIYFGVYRWLTTSVGL